MIVVRRRNDYFSCNANLWVMINMQYNLAEMGAGNFHVVLLLLAAWFVICRHIKAMAGNAVV